MILFAFSSNSSKLSGLSPIWYILITGFSPEVVSAAFLLLPVRFPQAARPAAKATTLADAKAYFFQFFMIKTPFFIFKLINDLMILTSATKMKLGREKRCFSVSPILSHHRWSNLLQSSVGRMDTESRLEGLQPQPWPYDLFLSVEQLPVGQIGRLLLQCSPYFAGFA